MSDLTAGPPVAAVARNGRSTVPAAQKCDEQEARTVCSQSVERLGEEMRGEGDAGPETPGSKSRGRPNGIGPPTCRVVQKTVPGLLRTLPVSLPDCVPYFTKSALSCNRL
jgi:hypothetical protein